MMLFAKKRKKKKAFSPLVGADTSREIEKKWARGMMALAEMRKATPIENK